MSSELLRQEEIDALLNNQQEAISETGEQASGTEGKDTETLNELKTEAGALSNEEADALGEIGNICMGSASTSLSTLLNQRVSITSPKVSAATTQEEFFKNFKLPYIAIGVKFIEGLKGFNFFILKEIDAIAIANLMMGESGDKGEVRKQSTDDLEPDIEITELQLSATGESMNQMISSAATAMATLFQRRVNISPPSVSVIKQESAPLLFLEKDPIVVIAFKMLIGEFIDTEIVQIMNLGAAKEQASLILQHFSPSLEDEKKLEQSDLDFTLTDESPAPSFEIKQDEKYGVSFGTEKSAFPPGKPVDAVGLELGFENRKMNLILDIPLNVTVVLGRTRKSIKEVLNLAPGGIFELTALIDEPVEVLVNGTLVARGEVVVVNENFAVRITSIINPADRIQYLEF